MRFHDGFKYDCHRLKIYHTAFRILRNRQDAEDATQRTFQRAFTNLGGFREDATSSTCMIRISINEAIMMLRHRLADKPIEGNKAELRERFSVLYLAYNV